MKIRIPVFGPGRVSRPALPLAAGWLLLGCLQAGEATSPSIPPAPVGVEHTEGIGTAEEAALPPTPEGTDLFSNACTPPVKRTEVPKTLDALRRQVGESFHTARRGPFLVASDLDAAEFPLLIDGVLACCRECLARDFFARGPTEPVTVYVFRDETSYAAHLRLLFGMDPISPYGHYGHSQRYIVINYATGPGTLVHELTHALMAPDFPEAPIWISEGMASLYEQCRVEGETMRGEPNWRLPELHAALARGRATPLAELFSLGAGDFRSRNESLHYAESRYFCRFLEERNLLKPVYRAFRDRYAEDPTGTKFVEEAFGRPLSAIEAEWHRWLRAERWTEEGR